MARVSHTIALLFLEPASSDFLADIQTELFKDAPILEHLPLPEKLAGNEVWRKKKTGGGEGMRPRL